MNQSYKEMKNVSRSRVIIWTYLLGGLALARLVSAQEYSPQSQALIREAEQLDRDKNTYNAECSGRVLYGAELANCQQRRASILARWNSLEARGKALKQAEAAKRYSESAARAPNLETAHKQASIPFDGSVRLPPANDTMVVDARGLARTPPISD